MTLELADSPVDDGSIPVKELKVGQVARITCCVGDYSGAVIKCNKDHIVGITCNTYWDRLSIGTHFRCKVMPNGTLLRVVDNE